MKSITFLIGCILSSTCLAGGGGPLGIDEIVERSDTGIWSRSNQVNLGIAAGIVTVAGAITQGKETRLGQTFWESLDGGVLSPITTIVIQVITSRERPRDGGGPDAWFKGAKYRSFPSGEVSFMTALVTPFMFEYGRQYPLTYGLAALPIYIGIGRIKSQAHWQTDVLAGFITGGIIGYYFHSRPEPASALLFNVKPVESGGVVFGFEKNF